jgi:hypothetical protein
MVFVFMKVLVLQLIWMEPLAVLDVRRVKIFLGAITLSVLTLEW